ncbi:MAG: hypothetical protein AAFP13_09865 [Pseudomonadota bacterium]
MMIERNFSSGPIQDLADFYTRWPSQRSIVDRVIAEPSLSEEEREVIIWLKRLADRVGPQDIADPRDDLPPGSQRS